MKKIPRDAEASNVLVGEVDFLNKPFVAFVRLSQATQLGGLTEVPVPTRWNHLQYASLPHPDSKFTVSVLVLTFVSRLYRFLFILLGPQGKAKSYNEIGRAIATLMVDDVSVCQCVLKCLRVVRKPELRLKLWIWQRGVFLNLLICWDNCCCNYIWQWCWCWNVKTWNMLSIRMLMGLLFGCWNQFKLFPPVSRSTKTNVLF